MDSSGFNLRRAKKNNRRAIDHLRGLSEDCSELRPHDTDGMSEEEIHSFISSVKKASSAKWQKVAVHGQGETWTQMPLDYNPYHTSPLVNTPPPDDRFRRLPGAGTNNTNRSDEDNTGNQDGSTPSLHRLKIDQALESTKGPKFVVRIKLLEHEEPTDDLAKKLFEDDRAQCDGHSVYIIVNEEEARDFNKRVPGSRIEPENSPIEPEKGRKQ